MRPFLCRVSACLIVLGGWPLSRLAAQGTSAPSAAPAALTAVEQGGAEDKAAFRAARAVVDPQQRMAALLRFARDFPESGLRPRATELALETALRRFPDPPNGPDELHSPERTEQVHQLAAQEIADAPAGLERWIEEARVADALASAEPSGADLPEARRWAGEALAALTEEGFRRETVAAQRRYGLPPMTAREMHRDFVRNRVLFLSALAHVELREGKPAFAEPLLAEAYRLDPLASEVNALRGELALALPVGSGRRDAEALESFERAEVTGTLPAPQRQQLSQLYAKSGGGGGEAGLAAQLDALYARLFPAVFTLPPRALAGGGRTVLLELFTGAGCEPCVAPDLAVESLLTSYRRRDLVALEWDENIPRPDPLTSPASEGRAGIYRVGTTPEAFLDGAPLPVPGSSRGDAENVVVGFADEIENEAAQPSPLRLTLGASSAPGSVSAHVVISPGPSDTLARLRGRPVVHVALVQDHLRYGGENGVRFHRMVVRALGPETVLRLQAAGTGEPPLSQTVDASFDLQTVRNELRSYLDAYERGNDRYGEVHFGTKDLPLDPAQLAVVVWVQDPATHEVLQAAYASAGGGR